MFFERFSCASAALRGQAGGVKGAAPIRSLGAVGKGRDKNHIVGEVEGVRMMDF
jgi:hypothetical protein